MAQPNLIMPVLLQDINKWTCFVSQLGFLVEGQMPQNAIEHLTLLKQQIRPFLIKILQEEGGEEQVDYLIHDGTIYDYLAHLLTYDIPEDYKIMLRVLHDLMFTQLCNIIAKLNLYYNQDNGFQQFIQYIIETRAQIPDSNICRSFASDTRAEFTFCHKIAYSVLDNVYHIQYTLANSPHNELYDGTTLGTHVSRMNFH